ncbi:MAG: hypothetical protein SWH61_04305 [Thermodesulfobacteriota bacterium]|nr:hypothetical protein [Thermodesulfobacteriota bacterium]
MKKVSLFILVLFFVAANDAATALGDGFVKIAQPRRTVFYRKQWAEIGFFTIIILNYSKQPIFHSCFSLLVQRKVCKRKGAPQLGLPLHVHSYVAIGKCNGSLQASSKKEPGSFAGSRGGARGTGW